MSSMRTMAALGAIFCVSFVARAQGLYTAVEVDRFSAPHNVAFPVNAQEALAEEIAREISVEFPTVLIVRQGETAPEHQALLRISGVVTRYDTTKKRFGLGGPMIEVLVTFLDAFSEKVLLNRELQGKVMIGSGDAGESLAKKIAKTCNAAHLLASN